VRLLAARAPKLAPALRAARKAGHAFVIIDGTLIAIDRVAKDRPFYAPSRSPDPPHLAVLERPGFVRTASALPGTTRIRLLSYSNLLRQAAGEGLSPPLEPQRLTAHVEQHGSPWADDGGCGDRLIYQGLRCAPRRRAVRTSSYQVKRQDQDGKGSLSLLHGIKTPVFPARSQ